MRRQFFDMSPLRSGVCGEAQLARKLLMYAVDFTESDNRRCTSLMLAHMRRINGNIIKSTVWTAHRVL